MQPTTLLAPSLAPSQWVVKLKAAPYSALLKLSISGTKKQQNTTPAGPQSYCPYRHHHGDQRSHCLVGNRLKEKQESEFSAASVRGLKLRDSSNAHHRPPAPSWLTVPQCFVCTSSSFEGHGSLNSTVRPSMPFGVGHCRVIKC